jgi:hypothetical protein
MKRRLLWLTAISAVAALVYAQSFTVRGAFGSGYAGAADSERPNSQFNFSVKQYQYNDQSWLGGFFTITVRESDSIVFVNIPRVQRLAVDAQNKSAEFSGPAYAVRRTRQGSERARGVAVVKVDDNRSWRDQDGDPDTIAVAFYTEEDGDPVYTYKGVVRRGDITVFEQSRSR